MKFNKRFLYNIYVINTKRNFRVS